MAAPILVGILARGRDAPLLQHELAAVEGTAPYDMPHLADAVVTCLTAVMSVS